MAPAEGQAAAGQDRRKIMAKALAQMALQMIAYDPWPPEREDSRA